MSKKFKTPYDGIRNRKQIDFTGDEGKTIQEQSEATDINNILERYARTGLIDHVQKHEPQYGEFAAYDFQANQNMIAKITQTFEELPARDRQHFNNDPQQFVEFIAQQENIDDMKDGKIGNKPPSEPVEETAPEAEKPVS